MVRHDSPALNLVYQFLDQTLKYMDRSEQLEFNCIFLDAVFNHTYILVEKRM